MHTAPAPLRLGIVGRGWRADFYHRVAAALPERFAVVGVATRTAEGRATETARWGVPVVETPTALVDRHRPDLVVTSVPWAANPSVVTELVHTGTPVLAETPPAPDRDGLRALWAGVGASGLVQVAEQHTRLPSIAARLALVADGTLGQVTSAQLSWTHGYHATAVLRALLGIGVAEPAVVRAVQVTGPLVEGPDRGGWPDRERVGAAVETHATIEAGGRLGVYDFTDGQWFNPVRTRRVVVRGSHGEVVDEHVTRLADVRTPVRAPLVRRQAGLDGNLEGWDLDTVTYEGRVLWRNPYAGARLAEEEVAVAALLDGCAAWLRDDRRGPGPYPLAEACQDHLLSLAIDEAAATGEAVRTGTEPWALPG